MSLADPTTPAPIAAAASAVAVEPARIDPRVAVAVLATVAVAVAAPAGAVPPWLAAGLVVAVVAVVGIPHGALDHLVGAGASTGEQRRFHVAYVAALVGAAAAWLAAPGLALVGFLALSVHHFGQSDLAALDLPAARRRALEASWGLVVVGLPLVAHLDAVGPLLADLGGADPSGWPWLADRWAVVAGGLLLQHVVVLVAVLGPADRAALAERGLISAAVAVLLLRADPLVGFAVYFGLWHSLAHLRVLADELVPAESSPARRWRSLARLAAPRTAVALAGTACLAAGAVALGRPELVLPAVVVALSLLTAPHLVVVERLWRGRRRRSAAANGAVGVESVGAAQRWTW